MDAASASYALPEFLGELSLEVKSKFGIDEQSPSSIHFLNHRIGLVIFDGLVPPDFDKPGYRSCFNAYIRPIFGLETFSILYLLKGDDCLNGFKLHEYTLSQSLTVEDALRLMFESGYPEREEFPQEGKEIAGEMVKVCDCTVLYPLD